MNVNFPTAQSQKVGSLWPSMHTLLDEGSLFLTSTTMVPAGQAAGTGIIITTSVSTDATAKAQVTPTMYLANKASPSDPNGKTISLMWMRFLVVVVPTNGTVWNWCIRADNTPSGRYTSGGTSMPIVNPNTGASSASAASIYFGALVTPLAGSNQRILGSGEVTANVPTIGEQWIFTFGDIRAGTNVLQAAGAKNLTVPCGPVLVAPGWNITLEMWGASYTTAAASFEWEMGWAERMSGL